MRVFLRGADPVGLILDPVLARDVRAEIVGVVGNVLKEGLRAVPVPEVYVVPAHRYAIGDEIHLAMRTAGDPTRLIGVARELVRDTRADVVVDELTTLSALVSTSLGTERSTSMTLRGLAVTALALAAVGLYGVLSYLIATRVRELGIRSALGASRSALAWLVVRDGMLPTLAGLGLGLVSAAGVTGVMTATLFGIGPRDPLSFVLAGGALVAVSLAACGMAARRATRIDPLIALRAE